jgi:hypothetical protein
MQALETQAAVARPVRRKLIHMVSITITPAEGRYAGHVRKVTTWSEANSHLRHIGWAGDAGYVKCDYVIKFNDGYEFKGRFDAQPREHTSSLDSDLARHVRRHCEFVIQNWSFDPKYQHDVDRASNFMRGYDVEQG